MLNSILGSQNRTFSQLAQSWLASGATAFGIWSFGKPVACWPEGADLSRADIVEPLYLASQPIGELRVAGLYNSTAIGRLRAEANLISSLIPLERDLDNLAEELVDTRDQLVALYSLSQATQNCQEIEQVLDQIVEEIVKMARAESAFLFLQVFAGEPLIASFPEMHLDVPLLFDLEERVTANGPQVFSPDRVLVTSSLSSGNLLLVPVQARGAERAALGILKKDGEFKASDIKMAKAIGEYAGMHIDNFLMLQRHVEYTRLQTEMELAKQVQTNLLPKHIPRLAGLDISAVCLPASQVGGDFYTYVERPNLPFTFVVGDISGKGMPAALLMATTSTMIRKEALNVPPNTPQTILQHVNADLYNDFTELSMFATVFVGQYDSANQTLVYANAGHSPVIYCPAGGPASLLNADGAPLGVMPKSQSRDQYLHFRYGDVFLVGTDGLSDAVNWRRQYFGYERLCQMTEALANQSAGKIAETILCTVADFADKSQLVDDQTLIVLKCTGSQS